MQDLQTPEAAPQAMPAISRSRKLLFTLVVVFLGYVGAEACASILYVRGVLWPEPDVFLFENSHRTIQFDAVRGYRLSRTPARFARVTHGEVCFNGVLRGNNEGFPDRDDFLPERPDAGTRRLAVFGDSFTAAQYVSCNWPDRVEDFAREAGVRLQLLNFSLEGSGFMNWLSTLERLILRSGYQLDGVVFAVFENDLVRGFHFCDDSNPPTDSAGQVRHRVGYVLSWDVDSLPGSLAEAEADLLPTRAFVVDHDGFERGLTGAWKPVDSRPFRPFILWRIANKLKIKWEGDERSVRRREAQRAYERDAAGQRRAYERMAQALRKLGVPVLVIGIPSLPELLGGVSGRGYQKLEFANAVGATFVEGAEAFAGLSPDELRAHWNRHDLHWNQKGSDRFARHVWEQRLLSGP